jgi:hypothetical protein
MRRHRSVRGNRRTSAANTARSAPVHTYVVVGWCGAGWRPRGAARGARRPWRRTCDTTAGPARAPARRSSTATAATRRDHVRPAITPGQRPRPDFWHPTGPAQHTELRPGGIAPPSSRESRVGSSARRAARGRPTVPGRSWVECLMSPGRSARRGDRFDVGRRRPEPESRGVDATGAWFIASA